MEDELKKLLYELEQLIRENNKEEILIGWNDIKAVFLKRFFPTLFSIIIRKQKAE